MRLRGGASQQYEFAIEKVRANTINGGKNMNEQRSYFKRALVLLMAVLMVFTYMPSGMWGSVETAYAETKTAAEVYSDTAVDVYVTVKDATEGYVKAEKLNVGQFDITPFMSETPKNFTSANYVTAANALIEAVYFNLYGVDPAYADLQKSDVIKAIKEKLVFKRSTYSDANSDTSETSIVSIFGNTSLVMTAVNDADSYTTMGTTAISAGDNVVFYDWTTDNIKTTLRGVTPNVSDWGSWGKFANFDFRLYTYTEDYYSSKTSLEGAVVTATNYYKNQEYESPYTYTDSMTGETGNTSLSIQPSPTAADGTTLNSLLLEISKDGMQSDYIRIDYTIDSSTAQPTITSTNKTATADTSLSSFKITAGDTVYNSYSSNLPYDVASTTDTIKVEITASKENAKIKFGSDEGEGTQTVTKNDLSLSGNETKFSFTVTNGEASEKYTFAVRKSDGTYNIDEAINAVLAKVSTVNADYILGKHEAGKQITEEEKEVFLKVVLNRGTMTYTPGTESKMIMALAALGIDARKVPSINSDSFDNLVSEVYNADFSQVSAVTQLPYVLYLTDSSLYPSGAATARQKVIDALKTADWSAYGIDSLAMISQAVAPYYLSADTGYNGISADDCAALKTKVETFLGKVGKVQGAYSSQQSNGSFDNNSNTTATVVEALAALKVDATTVASYGGKDVIQGLFLFQGSDKTFGYTGTTYNEYASMCAANALLAYKEYYNDGAKDKSGTIYDVTGTLTVLPESDWPQVETGLVATPKKTTYNINDTVSASDLKVEVIYNSRKSTATELNYDETGANGYTLTANLSEAGTKKVTVSYKGLSTNYNVTVNAGGGSTTPAAKTVKFTVDNLSKTVSESSYAISDNETVMDALKAILNKNGISVTIKNGNYVSSIGGKGEFDEGPNSGWMYRVNGVLTDKAANEYVLKEGDVVYWFYTPDWTKVSGATTMATSDVTTDTKTDVTTATADVKVTEKTATDGTKEKVATVTVSSANQREILKQAKANKSKEIVLNASSSTAKDASKVDVNLDKSFVNSIVSDTDAKLTVKTPLGDKTYTQDELKTLAASATGSTITLTIEKTDATVDTTDELDVKAEVAKLTPVARSAKTAKKNIKVTTNLDKTDKAIITELKDAGYTIKYRFYRSTKKSASYKPTLTKSTTTYLNTAGKAGTRYYYKVQVRVYDKDGKLVAKTALKQCKYATRVFG